MKFEPDLPDVLEQLQEIDVPVTKEYVELEASRFIGLGAGPELNQAGIAACARVIRDILAPTQGFANALAERNALPSNVEEVLALVIQLGYERNLAAGEIGDERLASLDMAIATLVTGLAQLWVPPLLILGLDSPEGVIVRFSLVKRPTEEWAEDVREYVAMNEKDPPDKVTIACLVAVRGKDAEVLQERMKRS